MRGLRKLTIMTALSLAALSPMGASMAPSSPEQTPKNQNLPVAMAQPLAAVDGAPIVAVTRRPGSRPALPESGMLVLVGSALIGLAALVRRTT